MEKFLIYIPLLVFLLSFTFNIYQYKHNEAIENRYLEQLLPEIDCYYKYYADPDEYKFLIKNTGLIDCENIWIEEKIYILVDNEVYEGRDVPHFNYIVYEGSRSKMYSFKKKLEKEIIIPKEQKIAIYQLQNKFNSKVVSRWLFTLSSSKSPKIHKFEKYFIFSDADRTFVEINEFVGGETYVNRMSAKKAAPYLLE